MKWNWVGQAWRGLAVLALLGPFEARAADTAWTWADDLQSLVARAQAERDPITTDRPDFTEASSVVGLGVAQLEMGYTFSYFDDESSGTLTRGHSGPEFLLRYGLSDLVELRLVWNYNWEKVRDGGVDTVNDGADDLLVGTKLALVEQCCWVPEQALVIHLVTPTGARAFSGQNADIQFNYLYGWDVTDDWSLAGSFGYSTTGEFDGLVLDRFNVFHHSSTVGHSFNDRLGAYFEYFGLYPEGMATNAGENYVNSGFTYLINNDTQFDIRAGKGLNDASEDFFGGAGLSIRN